MEEEAALALIGVETGITTENAPPAGGFPRLPMDLQRLAVDAQRRGAVLIVKRNQTFRLVGFLEIRESTAMRQLEWAMAIAPPGTLVVVIQISPNPAAEMGIGVKPVSYAEGVQSYRVRRHRASAATSNVCGRGD
jgi:hypothetical protein